MRWDIINNLAKKYNLAIVDVAHVSKRSAGNNANDAILGATDIVNASRSVLRVIFDETGSNPNRRVIVHTKSNYAPAGQSVAFEIDEDGALKWTDYAEVTKEDMEKWRQMFPYLDIEAEIENEEEYLARPKRKYTDIRRTFENHLKTQQYPPPPNADEVMRIGMERKLDITLEMATRFFNKHQAAGWRNDQWKPILDWRCLLENFVATWNQNHYGPQTGNFSQSIYGRPTESKPFDPSKYEN